MTTTPDLIEKLRACTVACERPHHQDIDPDIVAICPCKAGRVPSPQAAEAVKLLEPSCSRCHGTGRKYGNKDSLFGCYECDGKGRIPNITVDTLFQALLPMDYPTTYTNFLPDSKVWESTIDNAFRLGAKSYTADGLTPREALEAAFVAAMKEMK